ncbi:Transposable element P transposase [Aphis craccivora]|uniref:Transposable element P transposase n=1 Tax=Aphis craccivora TaxID=307492 RepID=A0A6G0Y511_APHCR|nr:Transposable element P transposase [Aphis craccivora]
MCYYKRFHEVCKILYDIGIKSVLLRNFNQDALENFFGPCVHLVTGIIIRSAVCLRLPIEH